MDIVFLSSSLKHVFCHMCVNWLHISCVNFTVPDGQCSRNASTKNNRAPVLLYFTCRIYVNIFFLFLIIVTTAISVFFCFLQQRKYCLHKLHSKCLSLCEGFVDTEAVRLGSSAPWWCLDIVQPSVCLFYVCKYIFDRNIYISCVLLICFC